MTDKWCSKNQQFVAVFTEAANRSHRDFKHSHSYKFIQLNSAPFRFKLKFLTKMCSGFICKKKVFYFISKSCFDFAHTKEFQSNFFFFQLLSFLCASPQWIISLMADQTQPPPIFTQIKLKYSNIVKNVDIKTLIWVWSSFLNVTFSCL